MKTLKQAQRYAERVQTMTGRRQLIFRVPAGSTAYVLGIRFATCDEDERAEYERGGAAFVEAEKGGAR